ncbi:MAG: HEAT repeat domain-containing protein [Planctomycetota bacterium]
MSLIDTLRVLRMLGAVLGLLFVLVAGTFGARWGSSGPHEVSGAVVKLTLPGEWYEFPERYKFEADLAYRGPGDKEAWVFNYPMRDFEDTVGLEDVFDAVVENFPTDAPLELTSDPQEVSLNGYAAIRATANGAMDGARYAMILVCAETTRDFHVICAATSPSRWKKDRPILERVVASFRLKGDPDPGRGQPAHQGPPSAEPARPAPSAREVNRATDQALEQTHAQAYVQFVDALRRETSLRVRGEMVQEWQARGLADQEGAWLELVLALAEGPTNAEIDAIVLQALEAHSQPVEAIVEALPRASLRVRRGLIQHLATASPERRVAFMEPLTDSPEQEHPGVLEAFLILGDVTPQRVSQLVRLQGPRWAQAPELREQLRLKAEADAGFVTALLDDPDPSVRSFGCSLIPALPEDGDARLAQTLPLLRDSMSDVRAAAAQALTALHTPRASWGLARALARERDPYARDSMLSALKAADPEATLGLIARLQRRQDADDQRGAALALRAFTAEAALEPLQAALGAADPAVVAAGLETLLALSQAGGAAALAPCRDAVAALDPEGELGPLRADALAALPAD